MTEEGPPQFGLRTKVEPLQIGDSQQFRIGTTIPHDIEPFKHPVCEIIEINQQGTATKNTLLMSDAAFQSAMLSLQEIGETAAIWKADLGLGQPISLGLQSALLRLAVGVISDEIVKKDFSQILGNTGVSPYPIGLNEVRLLSNHSARITTVCGNLTENCDAAHAALWLRTSVIDFNRDAIGVVSAREKKANESAAPKDTLAKLQESTSLTFIKNRGMYKFLGSVSRQIADS